MFRSRVARACALAAALAVLAAACGDDEESDAAASTTAAAGESRTSTAPEPTSDAVPRTTTEPAARVIEVAFAGGRVTGGVRTEAVSLGETVRLRVTSDVADRVHVHTYDVVADVAPGQPAEIEVDAAIPGRHEVELEERRRQLITLEVG